MQPKNWIDHKVHFTPDTWRTPKKQGNIILTGLNVTGADANHLIRCVQRFLKDVIEVPAQVIAAKRIRSNLIVAELSNVEDKIKVLRNRFMLLRKGTRVCIYADRAVRERVMLDQLAKRAEEEAAKGHSVRMGYMKVLVDGTIYRWSDDIQQVVEVTQGFLYYQRDVLKALFTAISNGSAHCINASTRNVGEEEEKA